MQRLDLTYWVTHFIHRRKSENEVEFSFDDENTGVSYTYKSPDYFDAEGNPQNVETYTEDDYFDGDVSAIEVLNKILSDGYIKSGWSFRNGRPTIYGPKSAVCFTEMPLYALIQYAKERSKACNVESYGIAFKRHELFQAGARPVIYGLSTEHCEADKDDPSAKAGGLRLLSSTKTDIGIKEQYRYVSTKLEETKCSQIDWTHEREWRWALIDNRYDVPGLPFLLSDEYADFFSEIIIIVATDKEKNWILDRLKRMHDSGGRDPGFGYNVKLIAKANVLSIEGLEGISGDLSSIRLEDIPMSSMSNMPDIVVKQETIDLVRNVWKEASELAYIASETYLNTVFNGEDKGSAGFSNVSTSKISEITQAFLNLEIAHSYSDYYVLYGLKQCNVQSIDVHEAGAKAAAEFLTERLGQEFYFHSRMD